MKPLLVSVLLLVAGCKSKETGQAVADTSAQIIGGALIPVGVVYQLTSPTEIERRKNERELNAKLDPIYQGKIDSIQKRNPELDARKIYSEGTHAFLPSVSGADTYPGLFDYKLRNSIPPKDEEILFSSPSAIALMQLVVVDKSTDPLYRSNIYMHFLDVAFPFKERFNREMLRLMTGESKK